MPTPTWYEADTDDEDRHVLRLTPADVPAPARSREAQDRAAIRARAEAATPGPWERRVAPREGYGIDAKAEYMRGTAKDNGEPLQVLIAESPDPDFAYVVPALTGDGPTSEANAEHIAGMDPATTLALLDALDKAEAEAERLRALMTPADRLLDEAGITWQSRARRLADMLAEERATVARVEALADSADREWHVPAKSLHLFENDFTRRRCVDADDLRAALAGGVAADAPTSSDGGAK